MVIVHFFCAGIDIYELASPPSAVQGVNVVRFFCAGLEIYGLVSPPSAVQGANRVHSFVRVLIFCMSDGPCDEAECLGGEDTSRAKCLHPYVERRICAGGQERQNRSEDI